MAKLKLKNKSLEEKLTLKEHVEITDANYIGTANGYDVFDVRTFDAMTSFVRGETGNPCDFTHGTNDFTTHIVNGSIHLYLFARADTNHVFGAAISEQEGEVIKYSDSNSYLTCNVCYESNSGTCNNIPQGELIPLHLIPGVEISGTFVAGDPDTKLSGLETIGGIVIERPEEPIETADTAEISTEETSDVDPLDQEPESTPEPEDISNFKYQIVGKEIYITHIKLTPAIKANHEINIPAEIDGKPVTKLWKYSLFLLDTENTRWTINCSANLNEIKNYAITAIKPGNITINNFSGKKYTKSIIEMGE